MNLIDYIVIGVVAVSLLFGLYRGFLSTLLHTGGTIACFFGSFWLYPKLAAMIQGNAELQRTLLTYTDASNRLGDLSTSVRKVSTLTADAIADIIAKVRLPEPLANILQYNLENEVYNGIDTVSDYISETILTACVNIICFLLCFVGLLIIVTLVSSLLRAVFKLPILKQLDSLAGGAFGLLRGVLLCYALFAIAPMVLTMVPVEGVNDLLQESLFAPVFNNGNLLMSIMNGQLTL